MKKPAGMHS